MIQKKMKKKQINTLFQEHLDLFTATEIINMF